MSIYRATRAQLFDHLVDLSLRAGHTNDYTFKLTQTLALNDATRKDLLKAIEQTKKELPRK